jgi:hypothetical protein
MTDDPEPTDVGHWELYVPLFEVEGAGRDYSGAVGAEINYGIADDVQLTVGVPLSFARDAGRTAWGAADLEASVKYRFYHDEASGVQIAAFPGVTLPTGNGQMSAGRVTGLLPVWLQKDIGHWSLFGGGGYAINPGPNNKDFWTGGAAITHQFDKRLTIGVEADWQGRDEIGGSTTTSLGLGAIYDLPGPLRILASGGPSFHQQNATGYHAFLAVGLDY